MGYSIGTGLLALGLAGLVWLAVDHRRRGRQSGSLDGSRRDAAAEPQRWWHGDIAAGGDSWSASCHSGNRRCGSG